MMQTRKPVAFLLLCLVIWLPYCSDWSDSKSEAFKNDDDDDFDDDDVWTDFSTGLMWQIWDIPNKYDWQDALSHCEELSHAGYNDWRLPTISELRTLIHGCDDTESAGDCTVSDICLTEDCMNNECAGCPVNEGPGEYGSYSPSDLFWQEYCWGEGEGIFYESVWYWSSSSAADDGSYAWIVWFDSARVDFAIKNDDFINCDGSVRCVRDEES